MIPASKPAIKPRRLAVGQYSTESTPGKNCNVATKATFTQFVQLKVSPGEFSVLQSFSLACLVGALVFGVSWGKRLSPVTLILAGLVVSLYCGALNQLMVIFHHDQLQSMFLWSTGTLTQTDWGGVERLWPAIKWAVCCAKAWRRLPCCC